ncbi:MAG: hypothetical protein ACO3EH_00395 [Ilumatobacteraceae bacterium]
MKTVSANPASIYYPTAAQRSDPNTFSMVAPTKSIDSFVFAMEEAQEALTSDFVEAGYLSKPQLDLHPLVDRHIAVVRMAGIVLVFAECSADLRTSLTVFLSSIEELLRTAQGNN